MNRRGFLKVLSATVLAPVLPAIGEPRRNPLFANRLSTWSGITIKRFPIERRDFGHIVMLGAESTYRGKPYRLGFQIYYRAWQRFTAAQREETWQLLERAIIRKIKPPAVLTKQLISDVSLELRRASRV